MKACAFLFFMIVSSAAWAQSDPSTLSVLNGTDSPRTSASDNGLETNQYVKRPKKVHKKQRKPASASSDATANQTPEPAPDLQNAQVAPLPRLSGEPVSSEFDNSGVPQPDSQSDQARKPGFGEKMRDLFLGGDLESIDRYRSFLDSNDIRKNLFEFTLATGYMYNASQSPYFYRNYIDSAPTAYVGLDLWLTPFLGIDADYRSTLLNEVKDSPTQDIYAGVGQTWFGLGLKFRRFFGLSPNSPALTVGIRYTDFTFAVSPGAVYRLKTYSQGPELNLNLNVPKGQLYSWTFGVTVDPYITHSEVSVGPNIESGDGNQTVGLGAEIGGEYRLSRETRVFFKFSALVYQSLFSDRSDALDPVTDAYAMNVPVSNAFYMFDLGVHLGR